MILHSIRVVLGQLHVARLEAGDGESLAEEEAHPDGVRAVQDGHALQDLWHICIRLIFVLGV